VCELTDAGFAALAEAAPGHVTAVREKLFDVLTPEQLGTLRDVGRAISAGLREECDAARAEGADAAEPAEGDGDAAGPCDDEPC
jgi:hypothetical protein